MTDPGERPPELVGVYAKIERANEHIKSLEPALRAFANANTYKVASHYNSETSTLSVIFVEVEPLPLSFSILIGEAVHQLRSSLDHLACCLITRANGTVTKRSGFPICVKWKEYRTTGRSMIDGVTASAEVIIHREQPFQRGADAADHPLAVLADLNNTDKHRLLLVTRTVLGHGDYDLTLAPPVSLAKGARQSQLIRAPIEHGTPLLQFETAQRKVDVSGNMRIAIALKEVGSARNEPVIPLLTQLSRHVSAIVKALEPAFDPLTPPTEG